MRSRFVTDLTFEASTVTTATVPPSRVMNSTRTPASRCRCGRPYRRHRFRGARPAAPRSERPGRTIESLRKLTTESVSLLVALLVQELEQRSLKIFRHCRRRSLAKDARRRDVRGHKGRALRAPGDVR